jgi:TetR/AcrR family transcriptional regulator, transcriptional repressor of bet genes
MKPKVDREERRAELGEAVWRVIATRGIEAVSIRNVAEESGWSRGVLQIYFRDKDDLMLAAFEQVAEHASRVTARAATGLTGLAALRAALLAYAKPDDEQRVVFTALEAFGVHAANKPAFARAYREVHARWRAQTEQLFRSMAADGELREDLDPVAAAAHYYAFTLGIGFLVYVDPEALAGDVAEQMVDVYVRSISAAAARGA